MTSRQNTNFYCLEEKSTFSYSFWPPSWPQTPLKRQAQGQANLLWWNFYWELWLGNRDQQDSGRVDPYNHDQPLLYSAFLPSSLLGSLFSLTLPRILTGQSWSTAKEASLCRRNQEKMTHTKRQKKYWNKYMSQNCICTNNWVSFCYKVKPFLGRLFHKL